MSGDTSQPEAFPSPAIAREDLLRFVAGDELSGQVLDEITRQLQIEGSPVKRWMHAFDKKAADPLNIDWKMLGDMTGKDD